MKDSITVKKSGFFHKYKNIQKAVNDSVDGGTIYIEAGKYTENITISDKHVRIVGIGDVVLTNDNAFSVVNLNGNATVELSNVQIIQAVHGNCVSLHKNDTLHLTDCHLTGEKTFKEKDYKYPVIFIGEHSEAYISRCHLTAHTCETIYAQTAKIHLTDSHLSGFGVRVRMQSHLAVNNLQVENPKYYGIQAVDSQVDINHFEMTDGGVALQTFSSTGRARYLTSKRPYWEAIQIESSDMKLENIFIVNSSSVSLDDGNRCPSIDISTESTVTLRDAHIQDSCSDNIRIRNSLVQMERIQIDGGDIGVNCYDAADVTIHTIDISKTLHNAINANDLKQLTVRNAKVMNCTTIKGRSLYPILYMQNIAAVVLEKIKIHQSRHQGIFMQNITHTDLHNIDISHVNVGIIIFNAKAKLHHVTINHCLHEALLTKDVTLYMEVATIENALQSVTATSQLYDDNTVAALQLEASSVDLNQVTILDKTAAIFICYKTLMNTKDTIIAGGIFVNQSIAEMQGVNRVDSDQSALPIRVGVNASLIISFTDPNTPVILNKDSSSYFTSNLTVSPQTVVQIEGSKDKQNKQPTSIHAEEKTQQKDKLIPFRIINKQDEDK